MGNKPQIRVLKHYFIICIFIIVFTLPQIMLYKEFILDSLLYDSKFYRMNYKDTYIYKGDVANGFRSHWIKFGIKDGKVASPVFDVKYYIEKNPDLKEVYGSDYVKAFEHFKEQGINEGRESSPVFSINYYREKNKDLASLTNMQLIKHYVEYGIKEGRIAHPEFNIQNYLIQYQKFNGTSVTDYRSALYNHLYMLR